MDPVSVLRGNPTLHPAVVTAHASAAEPESAKFTGSPVRPAFP
jgi:hypothetical protein